MLDVLLVATALAATLATALAVTVATAIAAALSSQILWSYVAYLYNLYIEVQSLTSHWVVEVHLNCLLTDLLDNAQHTITLSVAHRHLATNEENLLSQLAIYHKDVLWDVNNSLWYDLSVAILWLQSERYLLAWLLAHNSALELREKHTCTANELQRLTLA